jgi:hypothetical protein
MSQDLNFNFKSDHELSGFLQICGGHYSMIKQWCYVRSKYLSYLCQPEATCINYPPLFLSSKTTSSFHLRVTGILTREATLHSPQSSVSAQNFKFCVSAGTPPTRSASLCGVVDTTGVLMFGG